jgi:hypothetical protein
MPKDRESRGKLGPSKAKATDARFSNFESDPRYRLPSSKKTKTTIDKRFSKVLTDDDYTATAKVDVYGRKIKSDSKKKALERLYQKEEDEGEIEVDDDEVVLRELRAANKKYDPAREGGFSSSESDSDSESDEAKDDQDDEAAVDQPNMQRYRDEQATVETGEVTNRLAIVNLDWDHIKSTDLMALFVSFLPSGSGRIERVSIYPSEFGKERMQREELEGPPREIFNKKTRDDVQDEPEDSEDDEDSEEGDSDSDEDAKKDLIQEGDDEDFDNDALRSYQLDRLRYYYGVLVCSSAAAAQKIYEATDGSEYLSSSNFLDLRFIPDDLTFDDDPRDECDSVPAGYKPVEFVTDALQHSKVKLTWDMHPEEVMRKESIKKAFSGSRAEIADNDLRAYLASDSEGEDEDAEAEVADEAGDEVPLSKKELARQKMRAALGLSDEPVAKKSTDGPVGEMQITFTPALSEATAGKKQDTEETTIEKYKRKEKERKAKKREKSLAKREGNEGAEEVDEQPAEDLGFDDPFFTSEDPNKLTKSAIRKEERRKKRDVREAKEAEDAAQKAQLELLMADDNTGEPVGGNLKHFDMKEIMRSEKQKNKKLKKSKKTREERGGLQDGFDMEVGDARFKGVFEDHELAIDPSNPKFQATGAMKKLLDEGRRKRKASDQTPQQPSRPQDSKKPKTQHAEISNLVNSIKRKSALR